MLSAESGAGPGRWHTDKAYYQRKSWTPSEIIRKVVIMSAAQIRKDRCVYPEPLGYYGLRPGPYPGDAASA
ncbi:MAG: hypothetical protein ACLU9S_16340 [Oscillospiraceae bacterium]